MSSPLTCADGTVRVRVPAKINLALRVGELGADGYHPLVNLFQAVSMFDEVIARPADPGVISVSAQGEGVDRVPTDDTNLAVRAARALAVHAGGDLPGVELTIKKSIPVAGGMAGGSADAAAALLACSVLWDLDTGPDELRVLGSQVGSDVPFALMGGTALGHGRGDELMPVLSRGCFHWVLVLSDRGLATPAVYRRFDEMRLARPLQNPDALLNALAVGDVAGLGQHLANDLQQPAIDLRPDLADTLAIGREAGAVGALVSGSGPTCAFLARDENSAIGLSSALQVAGCGDAIRRVAGPVPGARLIT